MADRICMELDLTLHDIPEELWMDNPRGTRRLCEDERERLRELILRGEPVKRIAAAVGCVPSTVRYWQGKVA
jgi:hypothetical protein